MNDVDPASLPYRRGVGIALFNKAGLVFAAERIDTPGAWQMPQGGIDADEEPWPAALRELKEEIGTAKAERLAETDWLRYELPPHLVGHVWRGRYRGQEQKWFAARFTGGDSDIDLTADKHPEFSAWKWVPLAELPGMIVPFKRSLYLSVAKAFAPLQPGATLTQPPERTSACSAVSATSGLLPALITIVGLAFGHPLRSRRSSCGTAAPLAFVGRDIARESIVDPMPCHLAIHRHRLQIRRFEGRSQGRIGIGPSDRRGIGQRIGGHDDFVGVVVGFEGI